MATYAKCFYLQQLLKKSLKYSVYITSNNRRLSLSCCHKQLRIIFNNEFHTSSNLQKRRKTAEERKNPNMKEYSPKTKAPTVELWRNITVAELAQVLNRDINYVEDIFLNAIKGKNTIISDDKLLEQAIRRSGQRVRYIAKPTDEIKIIEEKDVFPRPPPDKSILKPRPPVVTVMGHVDHGKTTLLDALRQTNVVDQEFGGITQHIGAFSVVLDTGAKITFLDTPGHAAFSAMRARGANITDIVVLVVAADDGVMDQTIESIRMAKEANVPILVAINKTDAPNADIDRTENMLIEVGIQVENKGGDVQSVPISALKRRNLEKLTEALITQAELLEIGADPTGLVEAVVVESKVHQHRGRLCTVVVQRGTLKKGDVLVAGTVMGRVRVLKDAEGNILNEVSPGYPVEIEGWKDLPSAGELVLQVETEKKAKSVIKARESKKQLEQQETDIVAIRAKAEQHEREYKEKLKLKRSLGRTYRRDRGPRKPESEKKDTSIPYLNLIIKADVDGTLEAILDTLDTYNSKLCVMDLIHYDVGAVTENDIELAETFQAIILAFNVKCPENIQTKAETSNIIIKHHNVIYKLVDDIKEEINLRLSPIEVEEIIGEANVLQQFDINERNKKVPVAGCRCVKGLLKRSALYKLIRNQEVLFNGTLTSMRHLKEEVDQIKKDVECGLQLSDKTITFQPGDVLICYQMKSEPQFTDWNPGF